MSSYQDRRVDLVSGDPGFDVGRVKLKCALSVTDRVFSLSDPQILRFINYLKSGQRVYPLYRILKLDESTGGIVDSGRKDREP